MRTRTPVLVVAFNRPDSLRRCLDAVLAAQPTTLLLATDGPRLGHPGDEARCAEVRDLLDGVRIDGLLHRHDAPTNLGSGVRVASAVDWALREHPELIVLEDDLVADPSFFRYCDELLERYRGEPRVGMVSGGNYLLGRTHGPHSYYFSHGIGTWGWATWRRAWRHFDLGMAGWPAARAGGLLERLWPRPEIVDYWRTRFDELAPGRTDIWDYQWGFALWQAGLLQAVPARNLVVSIGFGSDATHLAGESGPLASLPLEALAFPLTHPPLVERDIAADLVEFHNVFQQLPDHPGGPR